MGIKSWILPYNRFRTHLFFSILGLEGPSPAWILVKKVAQTVQALQRGHLTSVRRPISYRICFMLRISFFSLFFFLLLGVVSGTWWKIPPFFLFSNPSLIYYFFTNRNAYYPSGVTLVFCLYPLIYKCKRLYFCQTLAQWYHRKSNKVSCFAHLKHLFCLS